MIYVLHFERAYKHARHYIGYSSTKGEDRIATDLSGNRMGPRLIQVVIAAGIKVELACILPGDRAAERKAKVAKAASPSRGLKSICAICRWEIREAQQWREINGDLDTANHL